MDKAQAKIKLNGLQPSNNGLIKRAFDSYHVPKNLLLEVHLPGSKTWRLAAKEQTISFFPDAPSSNHENFPKERVREDLFSKIELLMSVMKFIPGDSQSKPSTGSSKTIKEKMLSGFLNPILTHHTVVSFCKMLLSPFQNISCVKSVIKKESGEKLHCRNAL
jgi:hypothetical protein